MEQLKKNSPIGDPKIITPIFNRAIIFDTTQKSWHGVSVVRAPNKIYRKSIAIYYVCKPSKNADPRSRALYAPTQNQLKSPKIKKLIKLRSKNSTVSKVYKF